MPASDEEEPGTESIPLADLPQTDAAGKASFTVALDQVPASTKPLEANVVVRLAEPGGRAIERKLTLPVVPAAPMIGVKPLFSGKSLSDNDTAKFDVVMVGARRQRDGRHRAQMAVAQHRVRNISGIAAAAIGATSRSR